MDTNTMYIEHYVDLHNYISDNIYELDNNPNEYLCEVTLIELMLVQTFGNFILSGLYRMFSNYSIKKELKKIKEFKDNFKELKLSKEQIDSIINNKYYSKLDLKEKDINKIINDLNDIRTPESSLNNILKKPFDVQSLSESITNAISACLGFTTSFLKHIVPKGFKDSMFLYILKFNKDIGKIKLSNGNFYTSFINNFKKNHPLALPIDSVIPLNMLLYSDKVLTKIFGTTILFWPTILNKIFKILNFKNIKNKIKNIEQIKETINKYAQEKGLSSELNLYLEKEYPKMNLGEAVQESLETMMGTLKFIYYLKLFLQLCIDIINKNN